MHSLYKILLCCCAWAAVTALQNPALLAQYDIAVEHIESPADGSEHLAGFEVALQALIVNLGPASSPFAVIQFSVEDIDGQVVHGPQNVFVPGLAAGESTTVSGNPWMVNTTGLHTVKVTSVISDQNLANNQLSSTVLINENLIPKEQAIDVITSELISTSPIAETLVAFLHNNDKAQAHLEVGTIIEDYEGTISRDLDAKTYFFWFDNEQEAGWMHSTSFILFNAWTGDYEVLEAFTWPLINGEEIPSFVEEDNTTADQFYGTYDPGHPEAVTYTAVDRPVDARWALIFTGSPGSTKKEGEKAARKNDVNRIKNYLNNNPNGPKIADANIKTLTGGDGMNGATKEEVCQALKDFKNCDKLYVFYGGHGSRGGKAMLKGKDMSWKELACKLIENGAKEVCISIEACYSGTAESAMQDKSIPGAGGTTRTLSGELTYSSSSTKTTWRKNYCGTYYYKGLTECSKNLDADANGDKKVSIKEAIMWASNLDPKVGGRMPGCTNLDDGSRTTVTGKRSKSRTRGTTGKSIKYTVCSTCYVTETQAQPTDDDKNGEGTGEGGNTTTAQVQKTTTWFTRVYAWSRNARKAGTKVDIICDGTKIGEFDGAIPKKTKVCIASGPANCKKFVLKPSTGGIKPHGPDRTNTVIGNDDVIYLYTTTYLPGQNLFYSVPIDEEPGHTINASVNSVSGWNLSVSPTSLTTSVLINPEHVNLSGTVPSTATVGAPILASMIDANDGTGTHQFVDALVQTSTNTNIVDGDIISFNEVDLSGSILSSTGVINITDASIHMLQSGSINVDAGGQLNFSNSIIEPSLNVNYSANIDGTIEILAGSLIGPTNGLELNGADGTIDGGGAHNSQGDGLRLSGNLSGLTIDGFGITGSGGDGLVADGVFNFTVEGADISTSTGDDVVLQNNAFIIMLNSFYNSSKEDVPAGSILIRTWTTAFHVKNQDDEPLTNATVNVYDVNSALVTSLTADSDGFTANVDLTEYVNIGGTVTNYTPHTIEVIYNNSSTATTYTANSPNMHQLVLATALITDANERAMRAIGPPINIQPNPAQHLTSVSFELDAIVRATVRVVDIRGMEVAQLFSGSLDRGRHSFNWNAEGMPSGNYFVILESPTHASVAKIILSK